MSAAVANPLSKVGDRVNPIVVKEVRQGLRTRLFVASFLGLLAICTGAALITWEKGYELARDSSRLGRELFRIDFFCFAVVGLFIIPLNAYRSLARERDDETWSALALTTLTPRQIVRGKVLSFLVQGALYASAVAPFLLFSYFLGGISLVTVLLIMALAVGGQALLTTLAVCWATLAEGRLTRGASFLAILGMLAVALFSAVGLSSDIVRAPNDWLTRESLGALGCTGLFTLSAAALLFEVAVSRLSPPSANTALWPRLLLALHVLLPIAFVYSGFSHGDAAELGFAALVYDSLVLYLFGIGVLGESDAPPRLLRRFSLLVPGVRRGLLFLVLLEVALTLALVPMLGDDHPVAWHAYALVPAFLVLYLSLAALVGRVLLAGFMTSRGAPRVVALALLGLAGMVPPLAALVTGREADDPVFNAFNPFVTLSDGVGPTAYWNFREARTQPLVVVPVALAILVVTERLLRAREKQADALGIVQGGARAS